MKRQIIAIALTGLFALPAFANEEMDYPPQGTTTVPAKTTAQVRNDLIDAQRAGGIVVNAELGTTAKSMRTAGNMSRAEVLAELIDAQRSGNTVANAESGEKVNQL